MTRRATTRRHRYGLLGWLLLANCAAAGPMAERNQQLLVEIQQVHGISDDGRMAVQAILDRSGFAGQGNPAVTEHPMSSADCQASLVAAGVDYRNADNERICGDKYMAPLFDPSHESIEDSTVCIDKFEFPNIPCAYPVVWIRANEAAEVCAALGKRMCDAHEWEGACAGALTAPDYRFDLARGVDPATAVKRMRLAHNQAHQGSKAWAYGDGPRKRVCAAASHKSPGCNGGDWKRCGSNTYPTGAFPDCVSSLGVYDLHGNAAEHMNLPLRDDQMSSNGSSGLGVTEMKGSWFIFDGYQAHPDWCRWRAPYWHGGPVMDGKSHHNYHLGFRCCKDVVGGR